MKRCLMSIALFVLLTVVPGVCLANATVTTKKIERGNSINVEYPLVGDLDDKKIQTMVNQDILKQVRDFIKSTQSNNSVKAITGKYQVKYNNMNTLSVKMDISVMPKKGAYSTNYVKGLNYDLETGEILQYSDMQSVSLEDVNSALIKHLKDNNIEITGFKGIDFIPSEFYIDEKGDLVSVIPEGIIGPHAIGVLQFKVF